MTISAITGKPIEPARARATHPATSHAAAARVKVTKQQEYCLRAVRLHGPGTGDQIRDWIREAGFKTSDSGPRSRCAKLRDHGLMRVVGHIGKHAIFALTDAGHTKATELARIAKAEREAPARLVA